MAVICHPHPQHGGTMDNKVVQTLARTMVQLGYTAVRFNFRGVAGSEGSWDQGHGEVQDALAVIAAHQAGGLDARLAVVEGGLCALIGTAGLAVFTLVQAEEDVVLVIAHARRL